MISVILQKEKEQRPYPFKIHNCSGHWLPFPLMAYISVLELEFFIG
jgi:hypothetical protein